jgi:hypothetical protein
MATGVSMVGGSWVIEIFGISYHAAVNTKVVSCDIITQEKY